MFGTHGLTLFIVSGLLLNIAPGPDTLLIMTRSATQAWRAVSSALDSQRFKVSRTVARWINRLIGTVFVSFGIKLALSDRS